MPDPKFVLSDRARPLVMVVAAMLILLFINIEIAGKKRIIRDGTTVLLPLAPRDPRSLLQGDYMALRYSMATTVAKAAVAAGLSDGVAVIELQNDATANFVAIYQDQALGNNQLLLRFRKRGDSVRLASDAFFFEEGQWDVYSSARFGELRVDSGGDAVLTGLRNGQREPLGVALHGF